MVKPAIFVLGISALPLARKIKTALDGADIHAPHAIAGHDIGYANAAAELQRLFVEPRGIVGLCASGILIRALAPVLGDKHSEPPVISVAEDGSSFVPLLGGHHGANELARDLAKLLGGHAAITTASELRFGMSLEEPPEGYVLGNPDEAKAIAAAMLASGETDAEKWITRTEFTPESPSRKFIYHPQILAVGVGCERGTAPGEVSELIIRTLASANLSPHAIACHATIDLKEDEPAINALHNVRFFTADELNAEAHRLNNPSEIVMAETGTPGVAEAAALAAAGPAAELIVAKTKSKRATCAVARADHPIVDFKGRERGILSVIGLGPGAAPMRSPQASRALDEASDWVGYELYLELAGDRHQGQALHPFPLGGEEDRVRHAIALAKQGKRVALICSGDAGIYAMAALVYEIADVEPCRIEVNVIPGISAFQAAAAKAGAMIGHDFCCISLSDLLTPWQVIANRIEAAAEGDFVIAFYNPRSLQRRDQLERAFAILGNHRRSDTPVVVASNLGRAGEAVRIVRFDDFKPEDVDMLTLVMVGSSQSKSFTRGDGKTYAYTPRGYAAKRSRP